LISAAAEQIFGRVPLVVFRQERGDKFGERVGVGVDAIKGFLLVLTGDAAEAGTGRVDEHEIAGVEQALIVIDDRVGCRLRMGVVGGNHPLGAKSAHVQPYGR
jgi:hypothetical protein